MGLFNFIRNVVDYINWQEDINDIYKRVCIKSDIEARTNKIELPSASDPLSEYYENIHNHFNRSPKFKLENTKWIDIRINELKTLRKNKKIEFVDFCKQIKKLNHMKNRQIKRQRDFHNNYTKKYDYYNPLVNAQLYSETYDKCRAGVAWKRPYQNFNLHRVRNIAYIIDSMKRLDINTRPHKHFKVNERGKIRDISAPDVNERLIQSILSTYILHPLADRTLIYDNYACQKGKGIDLAIKRYTKFLSDAFKKYGSAENIYVLKLDVKHFFESINHEKAIKIWSRYVKTPETLAIMKQIFGKYITSTGEHTDTGLCLGSELSQLTATLFLSRIDHIVKERFRVKYGRYNDDIFIIHNSREYLLEIIKFIENEMAKLGLRLNKEKSMLVCMKRRDGVKMLKVKFIYDRKKNNGRVILISGRESAVRERRKLRKMFKKLKKREITFEYIYSIYKGWRKHILKTYNAYNLICFNDEYFKKLYGIKYVNFKNNIIEFHEIKRNKLYVLDNKLLKFRNELVENRARNYMPFISYKDHNNKKLCKVYYELDIDPVVEEHNRQEAIKNCNRLEKMSLKLARINRENAIEEQSKMKSKTK